MQAADKRANDAEAKHRQLVDKDLPELDKLRRDLGERDKAVDTLTKANQDLLVQVAFLTDNTVAWRNSATALRLLDRTKVTVDSDGNVTGMKAALEALSKSDPYLVAPAAGEGDGTAGANNGTPPATPPANGGVGGTGKPNEEALKKRFPALRQRLG
jgi:hypothetical protein